MLMTVLLTDTCGTYELYVPSYNLRRLAPIFQGLTPSCLMLYNFGCSTCAEKPNFILFKPEFFWILFNSLGSSFYFEDLHIQLTFINNCFITNQLDYIKMLPFWNPFCCEYFPSSNAQLGLFFLGGGRGNFWLLVFFALCFKFEGCLRVLVHNPIPPPCSHNHSSNSILFWAKTREQKKEVPLFRQGVQRMRFDINCSQSSIFS